MRQHSIESHKIILFVLLVLGFFAPALFAQAKSAKATFAGGCFWCVEEVFEKVDGVISATSGFTGGGSKAPTYKDVSSGATQHLESVLVVYDPDIVSYEKLLEVFWRNIDPTDSRGQFCDRGAQYRSGIFYYNDQQKELAEKSAAQIETTLNHKVVTPILPATEFFPAEGGHQDYYKKNALNYKQYKVRCGRERQLRELWGNGEGMK